LFEFNRADIQASETSKVSEIAAYMNQNPSLRIGIDGSMDPRGTDPRNQDLSDPRISAVRDALIGAGVPSSKIQSDAYGDAKLARDRRVEVRWGPQRLLTGKIDPILPLDDALPGGLLRQTTRRGFSGEARAGIE
jgi:outer membrane protein OmpA-like peptidoglycan-associated protein